MRAVLRDTRGTGRARPSDDGFSEARGDVVLRYDGTPEARAALRAAIEQAEAFGGRLLIVFGIEPPGPRGG